MPPGGGVSAGDDGNAHPACDNCDPGDEFHCTMSILYTKGASGQCAPGDEDLFNSNACMHVNAFIIDGVSGGWPDDWPNDHECAQGKEGAKLRCQAACQSYENWLGINTDMQSVVCDKSAVSKLPCPDGSNGDDTGTSTGMSSAMVCTGWAPSRSVQHLPPPSCPPRPPPCPTLGDVLIHARFYEALLLDPTPLVACDHAWFEEDGTGFVLRNVAPGDLAAEIGLRSGDRPISLNGMPLRTFDDVVYAFGKVRDRVGAPIVLDLERAGNPETLRFEVER
mgnify:CR=1 FL=1